MKLPPYDVIKAATKIGIFKSEDRPWQKLPRPTSNTSLLEYVCKCTTKAIRIEERSNKGIDVLCKPWQLGTNKIRVTYYIGQCGRCKVVYWSTLLVIFGMFLTQFIN